MAPRSGAELKRLLSKLSLAIATALDIGPTLTEQLDELKFLLITSLWSSFYDRGFENSLLRNTAVADHMGEVAVSLEQLFSGGRGDSSRRGPRATWEVSTELSPSKITLQIFPTPNRDTYARRSS